MSTSIRISSQEVRDTNSWNLRCLCLHVHFSQVSRGPRVLYLLANSYSIIHMYPRLSGLDMAPDSSTALATEVSLVERSRAMSRKQPTSESCGARLRPFGLRVANFGIPRPIQKLGRPENIVASVGSRRLESILYSTPGKLLE